MRITSGKEAFSPKLVGDSRWAELAAAALETNAEVHRYAHGFHTYPAGLHPDAAAMLIEACGGDSLFDPFCGGGTTLVEGRAAGMLTIGRDVSLTALRVATARTFDLNEELATTFRSRARAIAKIAQSERAQVDSRIEQALSDWYAPCALEELSIIQQEIERSDESIKPLLLACFSSILVKVSWRRSDTSARREVHRRPPKTTAVLFHKKARELARKLLEFGAKVPAHTPPSDIRFADARTVHLDEKVDLVVTSPPYPSTYDYLPMQHLRRIWFDEPRGDQAELGARRYWREQSKKARKSWVDDTHRWTASVSNCLNDDGFLVVVIGDGLEPKGKVDTLQPTLSAAKKAGLTGVAYATVERPDHARDTTRWEHILIFCKQTNA